MAKKALIKSYPGMPVEIEWDYKKSAFNPNPLTVNPTARRIWRAHTSKMPTSDLTKDGDIFYYETLEPPTNLLAEEITSNSFKAKWTLAQGANGAKLTVFTDSERKTRHPDYNGLLVTGTERVINIEVTGHIEFDMVSCIDGVNKSATSASCVVTLQTLLAKATAAGFSASNTNDAAAYATTSAPGLSGTYTKGQAGLMTTYADLSVSLPGGTGSGFYRDDYASLNLGAAAVGTTIEILGLYKSTGTGQSHRIAAISTAAGSASSMQWAHSDTGGASTDMRFFVRNSTMSAMVDAIFAGLRNSATKLVCMQATKLDASNYQFRVWLRVTGGAATLLGTYVVPISGNTFTTDVFGLGAWVDDTPSQWMTGRIQYQGIRQAASARTDAEIRAIMDTGTLAA